MTTALYVLHSIAFIAQVAGGVLVVIETVSTLRNVHKLRDDLTSAEAMKQQHLDALKSYPTSIPLSRFGGGSISLPRLTPEAQEGLVQQFGPGVAAERTALRTFLEGQFPSDRRRAWLGVWLLFGGIAVGFIATMLDVAV